MDLTPFQIIAGVAGSALSGSGGTLVSNWLTNRRERRAFADGYVERAIEVAMRSTATEIERLNEETKDQRAEINKLKRDHAEEVVRLREQHAECERGQMELRREIERLMAAQAAAYKPEDLRRVGPT